PSNPLNAAPESAISGRLVFEDAGFSCDQQCRVTLLSQGVRPVETVLADLGGNFSFHAVPRGNYSIRVEIDGYETVTSSVREADMMYGLNITVPLSRKPTTTSSKGSNVVNVSEFRERYPKRAVSYFEKATELRKKKQDDQAIKYFQDALDLAPNFYEA